MKCSNYILVLFALVASVFVSLSNGDCVMYGQCVYDEDREHFFNCPVNHTAIATTGEDWTPEIKALLVRRCPHILKSGEFYVIFLLCNEVYLIISYF